MRDQLSSWRDTFMLKAILATLVLMPACIAASEAFAAPCDRQKPATAIEIDVQEAPVAIHGEFSLAELEAMADQFRRPAAHPVLGFYAGTVGYTLRSLSIQDASSRTDSETCPRLSVEASLVAVDRRIAVARDLSAFPCRFRIAMEHYRHHTAAASLALDRFASELPGRLGPEIQRYAQTHSGSLQEIHLHVEGLLDGAVKAFSASLAQVQADVDSVDEVQKLSAPCSDT